MSSKLGETMFIFDNKITNRISKNDINDMYHIGDEGYFKGLQSRFSYYDTETKLIDRYDKSKLVIDFFLSFGFISGDNNFGPEYEQSYFITSESDHFIVRIKPNLFINLIYNGNSIYTGFFNRNVMDTIIASASSLRIKREFKLYELLEKKSK